MRQIHAVVNSAAGGGRARRAWPAVAEAIRGAGIDLIEHFTTHHGQAAEMARERILHNADEVLIVGGDGTINEVVNGLVHDGSTFPVSSTLSVIPLGSGNDFARNIGIHSTSEALATMLGDYVASLDVGLVTMAPTFRRAFVNSVDFGLGARVAARVNRSRKPFGGRAVYFAAALREIASAHSDRFRVTVDGHLMHDGQALMALVVNGRCYGGGIVAAPAASVIDGLLDVVVLKPTSKWRLACSLLPRVYRGTHVGDPGVIMARGKHIEIQSNHSGSMAIDGEIESATAARVSILPRSLRIRVPSSFITT